MPSISSQLVYASLSEVAALAAAKETEAQIRSGNYRGPLHSVPLAVKDIYEAGPTTGGSRLRKEYVALQDCTVVQRLKQAGSVLIGKLATYKFAASLADEVEKRVRSLFPFSVEARAQFLRAPNALWKSVASAPVLLIGDPVYR